MRFEPDRFDGVVIDPTSLPADINDLIIDLEELTTYLMQQRKSPAWISVPIVSAAS